MHCWGFHFTFSLQLILCGMRQGFCFVWKVLLKLGAHLLLDCSWVHFLTGWWHAFSSSSISTGFSNLAIFLDSTWLYIHLSPSFLQHLLALSWTSAPHHSYSHFNYYLTSQSPLNCYGRQAYKHLLRFHVCLRKWTDKPAKKKKKKKKKTSMWCTHRIKSRTKTSNIVHAHCWNKKKYTWHHTGMVGLAADLSCSWLQRTNGTCWQSIIYWHSEMTWDQTTWISDLSRAQSCPHM